VVERGFKVRAVTKSPGSLVSLGHIARKAFLPWLRRHRCTRDTLSGDRILALKNLFPIVDGGDNFTNRHFLSADLSKATDNLPFDLVNVLWETISEVCEIPNWLQRIIGKMIGPQVLVYPDGAQVETRRGILMGLPLTWITLSMIQLFWANRA